MTEIFIIFGLILLNGLFSMAEIALVSVRKARLESQANKGSKEAKRALELSQRPDTFIATVQFAITLIGLLTGIFSGENIKEELEAWLKQFSWAKDYSGSLATTLLLIVITFWTLVLGELLPKRIGLSRPETIAKLVAAPMSLLSKITFPFIWLLNVTTRIFATMLNIKQNDNQVTEEEIKAIINEGTDQGTIEEAEQEIIERVFHLSDRNITSLMTHRSEIIWLDIQLSVGEAKKIIQNNIYSIYPVCDGKIDIIKGAIILKDLFFAKDNMPIKQLLKPTMYVPENNTAYQVLEKFKSSKIHHCFIVDEYGSIEGLITLNDILDAIVGDMPQPDEEEYTIIGREDGSFLVDGQLPFYDFLQYFDKTEWLEEMEADYDTVAGFILDELKEIPKPGQKLGWRNFVLEIVDMDNHRIDKVLVINNNEEEA